MAASGVKGRKRKSQTSVCKNRLILSEDIMLQSERSFDGHCYICDKRSYRGASLLEIKEVDLEKYANEFCHKFLV